MKNSLYIGPIFSSWPGAIEIMEPAPALAVIIVHVHEKDLIKKNKDLWSASGRWIDLARPPLAN
jgi:hypothetical protein